MGKRKGLGTFVAGALIGAGLGVLFAPKKGSETRAELKAKLEDLYNAAKNLEIEDVKDYVENKIDEIKTSIEELDKEKVLAYAKEKGTLLKAKTEELVKYVNEKGTPAMKEAALSVKEKATQVTKEAINKLEKKEAALAAVEED